MEKRALFQRITLLIMAGMILLFGILTAVFRLNKGVFFLDSLLKITESEGQTVYSGKVYSLPTTITVTKTPGNNTLTTVHITIAGVTDDEFLVEYPLTPIATEYGSQVNGVRVTRNGRLEFEGGYDPDSSARWFEADGSWASPDFETWASGSQSPLIGYESSKSTAMQFALGPELSARGSWGSYALMVLLTVLLMLYVRFGIYFEVWRMSWYAQDPEPTDFFYFTEKIGWAIGAAALLIGYCWTLTIFV